MQSDLDTAKERRRMSWRRSCCRALLACLLGLLGRRLLLSLPCDNCSLLNLLVEMIDDESGSWLDLLLRRQCPSLGTRADDVFCKNG